MIRVGLDPALNSPGAAITRDGVLVHAWNVKVPRAFVRKPTGDRIQCLAELITADIEARGVRIGEVDVFVYECPQFYGVGVSKVDPNQLVLLAEVGATVAGRLRPRAVLRPLPREWTGGTSKNPDDPYDSSRWRRLKMILKPEEQIIVPEQHDAIDGVGLALHETPRGLSTPRRVYPGASPPRSAPRS